MTCTNCFNGCDDITSDQCVKYTGNDIPSLEINNGDSLLQVEQKLAGYLISALDGTGIVPTISETCDLLDTYLPSEGEITIVDFISALIQSACSLQTQVTGNTDDISDLNSQYTTNCISVVDNTDTHQVLQAVINKLCAVDATVTALVATISTNYVQLADLNSLIQSYISGTDVAQMSNRMVPYSVTPFFASASYLTGKFDGTGAGIGVWSKIYLCNGNNGTPDLRGRTLVGTTSGMGGGAFNSAVNPAISGNPTYSLNSVAGANNVTLTNVNQIPAHSHAATVNITDPTHFHYVASNSNNPKINLTSAYPIRYESDYGPNHAYLLYSVNSVANVGKSSSTSTGISVSVTNASAGGTASHSNIQPVIGCHYIMYIP
jgi:microcystin-dependent protein